MTPNSLIRGSDTVAWACPRLVEDPPVQSPLMAVWRIWTEPGSLAWADPGPEYVGMADAIADCAETLSPRGEPPTLSTYWIDLLLEGIDERRKGELAHGNLWVFTLNGENVEIRMDVDNPADEAVGSIDLGDLVSGLNALRGEVIRQLSTGHQLDGRIWSQKNPTR